MKGLYFIISRDQLNQLTAREVIDALRYERAYPASKPPAGYYMFQKVDPEPDRPQIDRWRAFGVTINGYDFSANRLRLTPPLPATGDPTGLDTFDLIGALQGLMDACDTGNQTPKQKAAFDRAAEVLNTYVRVGIKVFNR